MPYFDKNIKINNKRKMNCVFCSLFQGGTKITNIN